MRLWGLPILLVLAGCLASLTTMAVDTRFAKPCYQAIAGNQPGTTGIRTIELRKQPHHWVIRNGIEDVPYGVAIPAEIPGVLAVESRGREGSRFFWVVGEPERLPLYVEPANILEPSLLPPDIQVILLVVSLAGAHSSDGPNLAQEVARVSGKVVVATPGEIRGRFRWNARDEVGPTITQRDSRARIPVDNLPTEQDPWKTVVPEGLSGKPEAASARRIADRLIEWIESPLP